MWERGLGVGRWWWQIFDVTATPLPRPGSWKKFPYRKRRCEASRTPRGHILIPHLQTITNLPSPWSIGWARDVRVARGSRWHWVLTSAALCTLTPRLRTCVLLLPLSHSAPQALSDQLSRVQREQQRELSVHFSHLILAFSLSDLPARPTSNSPPRHLFS